MQIRNRGAVEREEGGLKVGVEVYEKEEIQGKKEGGNIVYQIIKG